MKRIKKIILGCLIIAVVVLYVLTLRNFKNTNQYNEKMRVNSGSIEYMNDGEWKKLTSVGEVIENNGVTKVKDGRKIEICIDEGYISWNYAGETNKNKLVAITDLVGEQGNNGVDGKDGKNGINGKNGSNGQDGTNGVDGKNTYIWIKYASANPENENVSLLDTPDTYMGIYYGSKDTAPDLQSEYVWYCTTKGEKGEKGDKGDTGDKGAKGDKGDNGEDTESVIKDYLYLKGNALLENEEGTLKYDGAIKVSEEWHSKNNGLATTDGYEIKLDKNKKYLIMYNCKADFLGNIPEKDFHVKLGVLKSGKEDVIILANVPSTELQGIDSYEASTSMIITGYDSISSFRLYCYGGSSFSYDATIFELSD